MDCTELRTLSLFSGVGMLDLGITAACDWLGVRHRCQGYAEWDAYASDKLLARMEDEALEPAPVWTGCLSELDASELRGRVDLVTAGPPCQPFSSAGKRIGIDDPRAFGDDGLGPLFHLCRIVAECRPALVFLENVPEFVSGGHFRSVGEELSRLGYAIESPLFLTAKAVGASHKRERVFVLAHSQQFSRQRWREFRNVARQSSNAEEEARKRKRSRGSTSDSSSGLDHTARTGPRERPGRERTRDAASVREREQDDFSRADSRQDARGNAGGASSGLGDASEPELQGQHSGVSDPEGRQAPGRPAALSGGVDLLFARDADAERTGPGAVRVPVVRDGDGVRGTGLGDVGVPGVPASRDGRGRSGLRDVPLFAPGRYADHISRDPVWQGILAEAPHLAPAVEPGFRQLVDGLPVVFDSARSDQLRCVGNGCVPLQAAVAFVTLLERAGFVGRQQT